MAQLSKFYKVTRQIMVEYISEQYMDKRIINTTPVDYTIYTGFDDNVYYTEKPRNIENIYNSIGGRDSITIRYITSDYSDIEVIISQEGTYEYYSK